MFEVLRRRRLLAGAAALCLALPVAASAQRALSGLGQPWPKAQDVSRSPSWHVYVFQLNGIKYIEVADLTGRIVSAVGTANREFIALPLGAFPQYVSIPDERAMLPLGVAAMTYATTVYQDADVTVTVAYTSDGGVATKAAAVTAGCTNPIECNTNIRPR